MYNLYSWYRFIFHFLFVTPKHRILFIYFFSNFLLFCYYTYKFDYEFNSLICKFLLICYFNIYVLFFVCNLLNSIFTFFFSLFFVCLSSISNFLFIAGKYFYVLGKFIDFIRFEYCVFFYLFLYDLFYLLFVCVSIPIIFFCIVIIQIAEATNDTIISMSYFPDNIRAVSNYINRVEMGLNLFVIDFFYKIFRCIFFGEIDIILNPFIYCSSKIYMFIFWIIDVYKNWLPWVCGRYDVEFIYILVLYFFLLVVISINVYNLLFYLFCVVALFGVVICIYNLELFVGFLWLIESTILLISILILMCFSVNGFLKFFFKIDYEFFFIFNFIFFFFFFLKLNKIIILNISIIFQYIYLWENYYEALVNFCMNDFTGLFTNLYIIFSLEFVVICLILLIGSLICINLYEIKSTISYNFPAYIEFFKVIVYYFFRTQDLKKQGVFYRGLTKLEKKKWFYSF